MADESWVERSVQSNVFVVESVKVPAATIAFGMGSQTEAVECGLCWALVSKQREAAHEKWHRDLIGDA